MFSNLSGQEEELVEGANGLYGYNRGEPYAQL